MGLVATLRSLIATFIACSLRMECRWSQYTSWTLAVIGGYRAGLLIPGFVMFPLRVSGMSWYAKDTVIRFLQATKMDLVCGVNGQFAEVPGLTFTGLVDLSKTPLRTQAGVCKRLSASMSTAKHTQCALRIHLGSAHQSGVTILATHVWTTCTCCTCPLASDRLN